MEKSEDAHRSFGCDQFEVRDAAPASWWMRRSDLLPLFRYRIAIELLGIVLTALAAHSGGFLPQMNTLSKTCQDILRRILYPKRFPGHGLAY
jgi:hypothetical protein